MESTYRRPVTVHVVTLTLKALEKGNLSKEEKEKYYLTRKMKISYSEEGKKVEAYIYSNLNVERAEGITVKIDGKDVFKDEKSQNILNMGNTYDPQDAYLLNKIIENDDAIDQALAVGR